jgi:hypothetical protein
MMDPEGKLKLIFVIILFNKNRPKREENVIGLILRK